MKTGISIMALIVMLFSSLLSGCGSSTTTTGGAGASTQAALPTISQEPGGSDVPDPCNLVSKSDMETITGEPVSQPKAMDGSASRSCDYTVVSDNRSASLMIIKPCSMADYFNMGTGDPVSGVGMHAAWDKTQLTVHTMNNACLIANGGGAPKGADPNSDAAALGTARQVALKAIEKGA